MRKGWFTVALVTVLGLTTFSATASAHERWGERGQRRVRVPARPAYSPYPTSAPPARRYERVKYRRNWVWIPGQYVWREGGYVWESGHWERKQRGRRWQEGRWERRHDRYTWVNGYWEDVNAQPTSPAPAPSYPAAHAACEYEWIEPHYDFQNGQYVWVEGRWDMKHTGHGDHYEVPQTTPSYPSYPSQTEPKYIWVEGKYQWRDGAYVWVEGHWKLEGSTDVNVTPVTPAQPAYGNDNGHWERVGDRYVWVNGGNVR
jgi:hypothetical protein